MEKSTVLQKRHKMRIYLAHPHAQRGYGKTIQSILEEEGYKVINPFNRLEQSSHDRIIKNNEQFSDEQCEKIVLSDLKNIEKADVVVAIWLGTNHMIGTPMEIVYAYNLALPIYSLYLWPDTVSPWIQYHSNKVLRSENDLLFALEAEAAWHE